MMKFSVLPMLVACFLSSLCTSPAPAQAVEPDEAQQHNTRQIAAAVETLLTRLKAQNPDGREYTLAVVPFPDDGGHLVRGVGVDFAQEIERRLMEHRPEWLRIQNRMLLRQVLKEHALSVTDIVRPKAGKPLPKEFVEQADLVLAGSIAWTRKAIGLEWRVMTTRTNAPVAAGKCELTMTPTLWDRQFFVNPRPGDPEVPRVPSVRTIDLSVNAQRRQGIGDVKQWTVQNGDTLHCGDQFNLRFSVDANAYVYILCYGSDKVAQVLYPPPTEWIRQARRQHGLGFTAPVAYARAFWPYAAPGEDRTGRAFFYVLDDKPGRNLFYIVAHRNEVPDIFDIGNRMTRATGDDHRLQILKEADLDCIRTFEFHQKKP
jgi:hypothetical protein